MLPRIKEADEKDRGTNSLESSYSKQGGTDMEFPLICNLVFGFAQLLVFLGNPLTQISNTHKSTQNAITFVCCTHQFWKSFHHFLIGVKIFEQRLNWNRRMSLKSRSRMSLGNTVSAPPVAAKLSPGTALLCHGLCCPQPSPPLFPPSPTPPLPPPPPPSTAQSVTVPLPVTQKHEAIDRG